MVSGVASAPRVLQPSIPGADATGLAKLAKALSPVTAESLRQCAAGKVHSPYRIPAIVLAFIIVVYSTLSFVTSAIALSIRNDITTANALAVKLTAAFDPTVDHATSNSAAAASSSNSQCPP